MYALYLWNRLEMDAHILTQSRSWAELVPFRGLVNFGLGGSIFGAKNYVFIIIINLLPLEAWTRCISGTEWSQTLIF